MFTQSQGLAPVMCTGYIHASAGLARRTVIRGYYRASAGCHGDWKPALASHKPCLRLEKVNKLIKVTEKLQMRCDRLTDEELTSVSITFIHFISFFSVGTWLGFGIMSL